ncbi:TonB-linked outer membrane receptor [gut metagenome]|uniref:TonB-linked outer membrane receptor n=1 Tax=gut metagenome TaxID=749906 RepID=J9CF32_9ZZZZ
MVASAIGYETVEKQVVLEHNQRMKLNLVLRQQATVLDEVVVLSGGVSTVKRSAYHAVAVDTKELQNSTKTLGDALAKLPGMKLRESGGVGSDMQLTLDGFSGKHVKVFIDGVPQDGVGSSFGLNNIPVNFAERIEVYKGVVPIEFGTDALGGVINIVTRKQPQRSFLDASYSYGSFHTQKSSVDFGRTWKNGLTFEVNAFQNYSKNDYKIDTYVTKFLEDGGEVTQTKNIERVKRFHDTYHNEAVIAKVGLVHQKYADRLMLGLTYSQLYQEIQTGVRQEVVFGDKHRRGHSWMPSLEYAKRDLGVKGLDVTLTANYNRNLTQNVDTASYKYNWYGEKKYTGTLGEQSRQDSELKNQNWNATFKAHYRLSPVHRFSFSQVYGSFERSSRSNVNGNPALSDFTIPKKTSKSISGLSYRYMPSEKGNLSVFGKYYRQNSEGPVSQNSDGVGNYVSLSKSVSSLGYGLASTYLPLPDLQVKLSYEKAFRLPTYEELFGDEDLEAGKVDLKPESSHNVNLNFSYQKRWGKHEVYWEGGLFYRYTRNYIQRGIGKHGSTYYGSYENHGRVETQGYHLAVRYSWSHWLNLGGTFSQTDARDKERFVAAGSSQESLTYGARMPNLPYQFANFDLTFSWMNLGGKGNRLSLTYDSYYQHAFPLYWENIGDASSKKLVPEQFSHNVSLTYSLRKGRYNLSLECRNLTDEALYDNYSLQKAGRAFYGKVRVRLGD